MRPLRLVEPGERIDVLLLGAHSDDIEIGAGATILTWIARGALVHATWCVASASGPRGAEARASAADFLTGAQSANVVTGDFMDGLFPSQETALKTWLMDIRQGSNADVIFTHRRDDAHQDHRTISALTSNIFRDHLTLEYEIPKWDGDLGPMNVYCHIPDQMLARKTSLLHEHFGTQRTKDWFDEETFRGLARLRGMECRSASRFAEAFSMRKGVVL